MVVTVKMATEVISFIQTNRFPRGGAVDINTGGEFKVGIIVVGHATIHRLGNVRQLLRVFNQIWAAFRTLALHPNFGGAIPYGDGLGKNVHWQKDCQNNCQK